MSDPQSTPPSWLAWVPFVIGIVTGVGYILRNLFISAVKNVTEGMHRDNQQRFGEVEDRLGKQEKTLAWIRGRMEERWGEDE